MHALELRYIAHISTLTARLQERCETAARTLRELIAELDGRYPGFQQIFVDPETGRLNLCGMIYSCEEGQLPVTVTDLDQPLGARGWVAFW